MVILMAGFFLSLNFMFHPSNWYKFSTDYEKHSKYVEYAAAHHQPPPPVKPYLIDYAAAHPPTYYLIAAAFYNAGQSLHPIETPIAYSYYLSLICLSCFWICSAFFLKLLLKPSTAYNVCLAMVVFWPVGITKSTFVGCDIMLYPAGMASIYFFCRWMIARNPFDICYAALAASFAVLVKSSGMFFIVISFLAMLRMLWNSRQKLSRLPLASIMLSLGAMAFCAYSTLSRSSLDYLMVQSRLNIHQPWLEMLHDWLWMYFYFDPIEFTRDTMINPFAGQAMFHFWHYYLRSLLVGDYITWNALAVLFAYGFVWQCIIMYIAYGLWKQKYLPQGNGVWHALLGIATLFTGVLLYRFHHHQPNQIADGRYVYPIITIITAYYGKTLEWYEETNRLMLFKIGRGLALGFITLSIVLIIAQNYVLSKPM